MLVIGVACWISEISQIPELRRCLDSVRQFRVILVDGKWYDMTGTQHSSIPEAYKIFKQYSNVETITAVGRPEWENRNLYLERCDTNDILLVLDTDEYLEIIDPVYDSNLIALKMTEVESFSVAFRGKAHGGGTYISKRGIIHPNKCRYDERHNRIKNSKGDILEYKHHVDGLLIYHDKAYRSEEREKAMRIRNNLKPFR